MNETLQNATEGLKQRLAAAGLDGVDVSIGQGFETGEGFFGKKKGETRDKVQINVSGEAIENDPAGARSAILAALGNVDAITQHVALENPKNHLDELRRELELFIEKGANIPANYLEWRGFDAKINHDTGWDDLRDHAIDRIQTSPLGVSFVITIPETKEERENRTASGDPLVNQLQENISSRLPEIKDMLVKRLTKYFGAQDEAAKQSIEEAVRNLNITVSNAYDGTMVEIRSPEQNATVDKKKKENLASGGNGEIIVDGKNEYTAEEKKLAETNILSKLSEAQLGKVLGRMFLHGGEKADEVFPLIAGREDMARAITRQLKVLKHSEAGQKDPELVKTIDKFIEDDTFKKHDMAAGNLKTTAIVSKSPAPDNAGTAKTPISIVLDLPDGRAAEVLAALAAPSQEAVAAQAPAPANTPVQDIIAAGPKTKEGWAALTEQQKAAEVAAQPGVRGVA